jgi:hypothetical protein
MPEGNYFETLAEQLADNHELREKRLREPSPAPAAHEPKPQSFEPNSPDDFFEKEDVRLCVDFIDYMAARDFPNAVTLSKRPPTRGYQVGKIALRAK